MNEEVILTLKIGPCSKCESTIRVTLLSLSLLKTKGFISLQALEELSENEDGCVGGGGRGKGECGTKTGYGFQRVEKGFYMMLD